MKTMGIARKLDDLGRIVIPKETRDLLDWGKNERLEIIQRGQEVVIRKYEPINALKDELIADAYKALESFAEGNGDPNQAKKLVRRLWGFVEHDAS